MAGSAPLGRPAHDLRPVNTTPGPPVTAHALRARMEPTGAGEYVRARACSSVINRIAPEHARVLDVGGGEGNLRRFLRSDLRQGYVVVDHLGEGHGSRVIGDLNRLPLRSGSFDSVCISDVLEHIVDDVSALESVWESVAPGGSLVIHVPSDRQALFRGIRMAQERAEEEDDQEFPHVRDGYSGVALKELAARLQPASIQVEPSFSWVASLVTDIDWMLWWRGLKAPRVLTWLTIRATRAPRRSQDLSLSSGLVCSVHKKTADQ